MLKQKAEVDRAMKPKVIYEISDFYFSNKGWVYFLISDDKRFLKIGKTKASLEERVSAINRREMFRANRFRLLIAYNDASLERHFLDFFDIYRARYNWIETNNSKQYLTYNELWKISTDYCRQHYGEYRKRKVSEAIHKFGQITREELCKIPPRKLAPQLLSIIERQLGFVRQDDSLTFEMTKT